jgi:CheY-like chemotaxis protein
MPVGGSLDLVTTNRAIEEGGAVPRGRYVLLTVKDTGVGMDARTRGRVFEPFFTTKSTGEGTGLGLAMVYGIVQQSGGHITVDSKPGQGAAFHIYLPQVEAELDAEGPRDARDAASGSETILVAEDEASIRDLARELLQELGYDILCAADGEEALHLAEEHPGPIHLVLADVVMPGLGGRALVDRIQARRPDTRALFMSGHGEDELLRQGLVREQVEFLPKPFGQSLLARRVRQILDRPVATV